MDSFKNKVLTFMSALSNAYKDEESREELPKLELKEGTLTEDFTAMLYAQYMLYRKVAGDESDIIDFTHLLNRLALQHIMEEKEEVDE